MVNSIKSLLILSCLLTMCLTTTACRRTPNGVWEDTKTAGRHMNRGIRSLGGKHGDSRQVRCRDDFMCGYNPDECYEPDFVPLRDDPNQNEMQMMDMVSPPPRETPGEPGSSVPGINAFRDPNTNPRWANVFRNVHFGYNSYLVKGEENINTVRDVADYLRRNPRTYIFVEGHCDERGPDAYNLALGSQRANAVRNMLISEGADPDHIFTISYGRERPLIVGHDEESWVQNRRVEFKVYER